jgi:hypothetical protein
VNIVREKRSKKQKIMNFDMKEVAVGGLILSSCHD